MALLYFFLLLLAPPVGGLWGLLRWARGEDLPKETRLPVEGPERSERVAQDQLRVATYNIAHGQGVKGAPTDWRDAPTTRGQLEALGAALRTLDADLVLLQEVDIRARRTHYVDQAKVLAEAAGYAYIARHPVWAKRYVPFPPWPLAHQLGAVRSANVILSRFPLREHRGFIFDKPGENAFWYNWFYIDRGAHRVTVELGDERRLTVWNVHLEAWGKQTRQAQARRLRQLVAAERGAVLLGGDFNTTPPEATRKRDFVDEPKDDYEGDDSIALFRDLPGVSEAIDAEAYVADEGAALTFPANDPSRRLDYLFATGGAWLLDSRVAPEAGTASDHLPVVATLALPPRTV